MTANLCQMLAAQIYWTRRLRGLTQAQLAKRADVSPNVIRDYEMTGKDPITYSMPTLKKIARALDIALVARFESPMKEQRILLAVPSFDDEGAA